VRRLLYLLPVVLFVVVAAYLGIGLTRDPHTLPSAMIDQPAPSFDLPGLGAHPGLATKDLVGNGPTLVNFFASWCVPCRVEHPMLMRLAEEGKIRLEGIAYKDKVADTTRFLGQLGDPYKRIGVDADGRVGIDFGVYGVPETYVVDREGRIRYRQVGPISPQDYENKLAPLLRELGKS
jgi:cytochrome c biogenesis protein CcmG, thiol:disulfide interchange protein DsbE